MLTDYINPDQICPNQEVTYGAGFTALDKEHIAMERVSRRLEQELCGYSVIGRFRQLGRRHRSFFAGPATGVGGG